MYKHENIVKICIDPYLLLSIKRGALGVAGGRLGLLELALDAGDLLEVVVGALRRAAVARGPVAARQQLRQKGARL